MVMPFLNVQQLLAAMQQPQPQAPQAQPFQLPSLMQTAPLPQNAAANAFLDRFGPYRLQAFDAMRPAPQITGGGMGLFEARGRKESGLLDPPKPVRTPTMRRGGEGGGGGTGGPGRN